ncbi:MmgE/PrpD family protein [Haloferax sp. YSSS75]|uniref:MmgE/PrpD family protein n=1 Tax=Haloferax sp. YSSS75 TaxID=3388564 RepID=UPI00398C8C19
MTADTKAKRQERTQTEAFVERCLDIDAADLTSDAEKRSHTLFVDLLGVMLGSAPTAESSQIVRDTIRAVYGQGDATVVGESEGSPTPAAAFANATIAHGIELDDTHSGASIHAGTVVIPAALAVGETEGATGTELLEAIVSGYECMIRISRAADPAELYRRGFHPTATCGVFGAALAAARLKGLSLEETVNAVGIAGSFSGGNQEYLATGTLSKRIQPGGAAQGGVLAAELASRGYTGPETILEGTNGFLAAYAGGGDVDRLFADIDDGYEFEITRTGIKPHACCRYNQTPIDAALQIQREHDVDPDDIDVIHVDLLGPAMDIVAEPRDNKVRPRGQTDAQFSLHYSVAVALVAGEAFLEQFDEPYLSDERVLSLADAVQVEHDPELDAHYPDYFPARVTIRTTDGEEHTAHLETCGGDPANPLSEEFLDYKYRTLAGRSLDETELDELHALATDLPNVDRVETLTAYLRG